VNKYLAFWSTNGSINTSDERFKSHVPLPYGLEELLQVETVKYTWNEGADTTTPFYGVLAQQIDTILPDLVYKPEETEAEYMLNYCEIIPVCINAIKDLNAKLPPKEISGKGTVPEEGTVTITVSTASDFVNPIIQATPIYTGSLRALNVGPWDPVTLSFNVYSRPGDFYWTLKNSAA
jgi:hypothetical protein